MIFHSELSVSQNDFELIIEADKAEKRYWLDLWHYRELLYFLGWRDFLVRYKQTVIGISWSVIRPLLTMLSFVVVFNKIAKLDFGTTPYPIAVLVGLLPWQLFSSALSESSNSLVSNSNLISKVYFPRMIVPMSSIFVSLIDFFVSLILLVFLMLFYSYLPGYKIIFVPFFLLLTMLAALSCGLLFASLNLKYRDFRFVVPFILQFGLYISPVGFTTELVPEKWQAIYSLNPLVGIISGFRWCFLDDAKISMLPIFVSIIFTVAFLYIGIHYFRKTEKTFADKI